MRLLEKGKKSFENCNHAYDICHDFFLSPSPLRHYFCLSLCIFCLESLKQNLKKIVYFLSVFFNRIRGGFSYPWSQN